MESQFADLPAGRFHWRAAGDPSAPPLLLLHGFPEYSGAWEEVAARLSDRFFCIAPDQRGYGLSPAPQDVPAYALRHLVADMRALLDAVVPGRTVTVVGHDWGASVAYGLAFAGPPVARLVILNGVHPACFQAALSAGGAQTAASQYILWLRREGSEDVLAREDCAKLTGVFSAGMDMSWLTPARRARYLAEWQRPGRLRGMVNWYRASPLVVPAPGEPAPPAPALDPARLRVRMPHLLVWGMDDTALLPEARAGLAGFCDDLSVEELSGCDHWLHHQRPDAVAALVAGFAG